MKMEECGLVQKAVKSVEDFDEQFFDLPKSKIIKLNTLLQTMIREHTKSISFEEGGNQ